MGESIKIELQKRVEEENRKREEERRKKEEEERKRAEEERKRIEEEFIKQERIKAAKKILEEAGINLPEEQPIREKEPLIINEVRPRPQQQREYVEQTSIKNGQKDADMKRKPQRGSTVAYDNENEPIMDKPQKGIMAIIGNPMLLIVLMGVISWAMIQIFSGSGVSQSVYRKDITRLEMDLVNVRASIEKVNSSILSTQDQINKINSSISGVKASDISALNARLDTMSKSISDIGTQNTSTSTIISDLKKRVVALEGKVP